jgi:hypothetical protein
MPNYCKRKRRKRDVENERRREVSSSKEAITRIYVFPSHSPINK